MTSHKSQNSDLMLSLAIDYMVNEKTIGKGIDTVYSELVKIEDLIIKPCLEGRTEFTPHLLYWARAIKKVWIDWTVSRYLFSLKVLRDQVETKIENLIGRRLPRHVFDKLEILGPQTEIPGSIISKELKLYDSLLFYLYQRIFYASLISGLSLWLKPTGPGEGEDEQTRDEPPISLTASERMFFGDFFKSGSEFHEKATVRVLNLTYEETMQFTEKQKFVMQYISYLNEDIKDPQEDPRNDTNEVEDDETRSAEVEAYGAVIDDILKTGANLDILEETLSYFKTPQVLSFAHRRLALLDENVEIEEWDEEQLFEMEEFKATLAEGSEIVQIAEDEKFLAACKLWSWLSKRYRLEIAKFRVQFDHRRHDLVREADSWNQQLAERQEMPSSVARTQQADPTTGQQDGPVSEQHEPTAIESEAEPVPAGGDGPSMEQNEVQAIEKQAVGVNQGKTAGQGPKGRKRKATAEEPTDVQPRRSKRLQSSAPSGKPVEDKPTIDEKPARRTTTKAKPKEAVESMKEKVAPAKSRGRKTAQPKSTSKPKGKKKGASAAASPKPRAKTGGGGGGGGAAAAAAAAIPKRNRKKR